METTSLMETTPPSPDDRECCRGAAWWKLPLLLTAVLLAMLVWRQGQPIIDTGASRTPGEAWTPSAAAIGEVVKLEIDFGNGARRLFDSLPWKEKMTVEDVMLAARDFRPGISYSQIGEGAKGFLTELEGLKNEGFGGRNWQYEVAGSPGTRSFCLESVNAGDLVRWTFAAMGDEQ
jgi:hypothetical protein